MEYKERYIFVWLDETQAIRYEVKPGMHLMDCNGDNWLKARFLEQNLEEEDIREWEDGVITNHFQDLLNGIWAEVEDVSIRYNHENRRYEVEVFEYIAFHLMESMWNIQALSYSYL
jgi:hypothetical protein